MDCKFEAHLDVNKGAEECSAVVGHLLSIVIKALGLTLSPAINIYIYTCVSNDHIIKHSSFVQNN